MLRNLLLAMVSMICMNLIPQDFTGNPVLPGYYADPSIVFYEGSYYVFATFDPWGGKEIALWETEDFINWKFHALNWPTKDQCKTEASTRSMVWAPGVIQGLNGKFYMYISVGSEIYVGVAEKPTGPWKNALADDQPLVRNQEAIDVHTIDAEAFIDTDRQAYLYWGSGWDWEDGHCLVAKLNPDMISFDGEFKDITPPGYFEAPYMVKYEDKYHLMYSEGKCIDTSYKVRYSTFDSPMGTWEEVSGKKILYSHPDKKVIGPGHHTIFKAKDQYYILYHRVSDFYPKGLYRQICIDKLEFDEDGYLLKVEPTQTGVPRFVSPAFNKSKNIALKASATASSNADKSSPEGAIDNSYGSLWAATSEDSAAWLNIDMGKAAQIGRCIIEFEFAHKVYNYIIEYSTDNENWEVYADKQNNTKRGIPVIEKKKVAARYIRITFERTSEKGPRPGIWEFGIYTE